ncbi:MAG TPA: sulfotransferase [Rhodanobacteraceae bacterium]
MATIEGLWRRAKIYLDTGQVWSARATLQTLIARDPGHLGALLILGGIAWSEDHVREATGYAHAAADLVGDDPVVIIAVINALVQSGETVAARDLLRHPALSGEKMTASLFLHRARSHQILEQHAQALECYDRAHALGTDGVQFRFFRATQLAFNGRLEEAESELERCVEMEIPFGRAYVELARFQRATPERNHLVQIAARIGQVEPGSENEAALEFARYKELEDLERYDDAWRALSKANTVMSARVQQDVARDARLLEQQLNLCDAEFLRPAGGNHADEPQPIFIIGMPRSGTTLLDRLLGAHPAVESTGELRDFGQQMRWMTDHCGVLAPDERTLECLPTLDFPELGRRYLAQTQWRAQNSRYFIDKLPANWVVAGLIHKALPNARIVHMVRDPMDVCFSNFRAFFSDGYAWSYDPAALTAHYRQYRTAMAHWHRTLPGVILDVAYADLVADPEATLRRVLSHCDLEWDPVCIDAKANAAPVATLSFAQARQPVHDRSLGAWSPYKDQLEGMRRALSDWIRA